MRAAIITALILGSAISIQANDRKPSIERTIKKDPKCVDKRHGSVRDGRDHRNVSCKERQREARERAKEAKARGNSK